MSKPNYVRKAEVIANGDYDMYRYSIQAQVAFFRQKPIRDGNPFTSVKEAVEYQNAKLKENPENLKECERLDNARIQRVKRLKRRIRYMVENFDCNFVTLTFTNDTLDNTTADTRHRYVKYWLHDNFPCAVANIDYGAKNGREHYHAIVPVARVDCSTWSYGALKGKTIPKGDKVNADKLSCYTAKLVNHAIKETTKGCRTIYSGVFGDCDMSLERSKIENKPISSENGVNVQENGNEAFLSVSDDDIKALDDLFLRGLGFE